MENKFYCKFCDYGTNKKDNYNRHLLSVKHNNSNIHTCNKCGKKFKHASNLSRHSKKCNEDISIIQQVIRENEEIQLTVENQNKVILNQQALMKELIETVGIRIQGNNNTNNRVDNSVDNSIVDNSNNTFNLQFFLNDTCKNAIDIDEFINSIVISFEDLENTSKVGYVEGMTNIIVKNLKNVGKSFRPMHCSDIKRKIIHVKLNGEWIRETPEDNTNLVRMVKYVTSKNMNKIVEWIQ
jgi:hypothetical protein